MGNENLAIYIIHGKQYYVYGCWDKDTPEGEFDFYDVETEDGRCLNLGDPFDEFPTYQDVSKIVEEDD